MHDKRFQPSTLVEMLRERAQTMGDDRGFIFLNDGERDETRLGYGGLERRARKIAARLQEVLKPGDRALLLYPPSLEYIAAFFGCLFAGVVAVPAYPPDPTRLGRTLPRLRAIIADAGVDLVLTTGKLAQMAGFLFADMPDMARLDWIATDGLEASLADAWREPVLRSEDLAFLQYTSGSTGNPKGVMLSHANLLHNEQIIQQMFGIDADSRLVSWLPLYHDMGLIGAVLQPVYVGIDAVLMSPIDFLKRPFRWVDALSRYRGTAAGGPNFAYDLVVRKTTPEQRDTLDLSPWRITCNGAEPVRRDTMQRFLEFFAPAGLSPTLFVPSYGLAECTLFVCGKGGDCPTTSLTVDRAALEDNRIVALDEGTPESDGMVFVSCGRPLGDYDVVIVDPSTKQKRGEDTVGEIWVRGKSVARGYWNRPEVNAEQFDAYVAGTGEGPYLRTGDLGFMRDGELYVTGRLKDLIIVRGANHYPQDIEWTVENTHPALRAGCGAAFSVEQDGQEVLVVVHECDLRDDVDPARLAEQVVEAIVAAHDVSPAAVVLIAARSIDKTSSGKIQRHAARQAFLDGTLEEIHRWQAPSTGTPAPSSPRTPASRAASTPSSTASSAPTGRAAVRMSEIERWLVARLGEELGLSPDAIDLRTPFSHYGMGSLEAVNLVGELEGWLGVTLPATMLFDFPTIEALARHLAGDVLDAVPTTARATGRDSQTQARARGARRPSLQEPVAIVGLGCRFPGAPDSQAFWELLTEGREAIVEVPAERWDIDAYYDPELSSHDTMNTRRAGFVEGIDRFDAGFFGLSTREAASMDPQQRLVLEVAWQTLADAAIAPGGLAGTRTGVFLGLSSHDFSLMQTDIPQRAGTGVASSIAANRLSYLLDLRGPSMVVDTACSSSLVALDIAVQNLRLGRCDLALAGGVNVILAPEMTIAFSQAGMMAPDGRCKTFDAAADGYVRGEGCGMVVLKRLSDAIDDGDRLLAIVRGTAVNQDGQSNGLTAPNGKAQQAVIADALMDASVEAGDISYVEAHGTGTELGDAIEVHSLNAALGAGRTGDAPRRPVYLGSVKTNIGHLEAAAGIAGLIKTTLALHHGVIPPHLNVETLNPKCEFEKTPFVIPNAPIAWPVSESAVEHGRGTTTRFAGVSSFGFGGTNAHVILASAPGDDAGGHGVSGDEHDVPMDGEAKPHERDTHVVTLSARTATALDALAGEYLERLDGRPDLRLADIAYTTNVGRDHAAERLAVVADSLDALREALEARRDGAKCARLFTGTAPSARPPVAFLFTGQGSQYPDMGRELYEREPVFRRTLEECARLVDPHLEAPLLSVMYPERGDDARIHQTAFAQPALFALEYALYTLWRSWGVEPDAVIGHSVGEYVAACVAGVFGLEEGLRLIAERGRLMQSLPRGGAMAVVFAAEDEVAEALAGYPQLALAAVNGPNNVVVSGAADALDALLDGLDEQGIMSQRLTVSHAFHSPLMDPILERFEAFAAGFEYRAPHIALVSNLTGALVGAGQVPDAAYWRDHIRRPVRFADGMRALSEAGYAHFLELGPAPVLANMARRSLGKNRASYYTSLEPSSGAFAKLFEAVAGLHCSGVALDWDGIARDGHYRKVVLPGYAFERRRCWPKTGELATFREKHKKR